MFFCHWHESQKGSADLEVTIEGKFSGYYYCYGCQKSGQVPMSDVEILRAKRTKGTQKPTNINWTRLNQEYITKRMTGQVSKPLRVSEETLNKLEWGWDYTAATFPERNENDEIIGILRRFPDRNKGVVSGSKRGLTIPRIKFDPSKKLYICEGLSDLSVILEAGCQGIARPCANFSSEMCLDFGSRFKNIVIIGDNDEAGIDGATKLTADFLQSEQEGSISCLLSPEPFNDLYEFYCAKGLEEVKSWLRLNQ